MEHLERLARAVEPQPPVGEHAVDVEHQEPDPAAHMTPARSRSCTLSAPTTRLPASTTTSAVIRYCSSRWTASAASSCGPIVLQLTVMTVRIGVLCTSRR